MIDDGVKKKALLAYACMIGGLFLGSVSIYAGGTELQSITLLAAGVGAYGGISLSIKCPKCGFNPYKHRILGFWIHLPWVGNKCEACSYEYSGKERSTPKRSLKFYLKLGLYIFVTIILLVIASALFRQYVSNHL